MCGRTRGVKGAGGEARRKNKRRSAFAGAPPSELYSFWIYLPYRYVANWLFILVPWPALNRYMQ